MGNIAVDIAKNVDFNKTVTKDIFKEVTTNVNLDGHLAEAEADAEAFGTEDYYALAETDTFAYVDVKPGESCTVQIDVIAEGTSTPLIQEGIGEVVIVDGREYVIPETVIQNFTQEDPLLNINFLEWSGGLDTNTPILEVTPLQVDGEFEVLSDKVMAFNAVDDVFENGFTDILASYTLTSPWEVDYGERDIVCDGETFTDNLTMHIPAGTIYEITFLDQDNDGVIDAKESEFVAFPEGESGEFRFDDVICPIDVYVQTDAEILDVGTSLWGYEALATCTFETPTPGTSEAFAYSESTAALDPILPFPVEPGVV